MKLPTNDEICTGSIPSTFDQEKKLIAGGYDIIIGTDEVGRGPLAGPVVACAVALKNYNSGIINQNLKELSLIRDSKKLSSKQREAIFDFIQEHFYVGLGLCDHETIDRTNILEASFLAMKKAVLDLRKKIKHNKEGKSIILVDGGKKIPNFSEEQLAIIGGDRLVKSISAASIIAKVTRDRIMVDFDVQYPQYGFSRHMGYGTKFHLDVLVKFGPSKIHRKSFGPVARSIRMGR
jgi:ribonuclease HII